MRRTVPVRKFPDEIEGVSAGRISSIKTQTPEASRTKESEIKHNLHDALNNDDRVMENTTYRLKPGETSIRQILIVPNDNGALGSEEDVKVRMTYTNTNKDESSFMSVEVWGAERDNWYELDRTPLNEVTGESAKTGNPYNHLIKGRTESQEADSRYIDKASHQLIQYSSKVLVTVDDVTNI